MKDNKPEVGVATATTTTAEPPKWGDSLGLIPPERQQVLAVLAEKQHTWVAQETQNLMQSAFFGVALTGAEVFFLAATTLANSTGNLETQVARLRSMNREDPSTWVDLGNLHLEGADLRRAMLEGANLVEAQLRGANLRGAQLEGANLREAQLEGADLGEAQLKGADLHRAELEGANLRRSQLKGATLTKAQLKGADLGGADLEGADLGGAQLKGANLRGVHLEGANLRGAQLKGTDFTSAFLDAQTILDRCRLTDDGVGPALADVHWNGASLIQLEWETIWILGDEQRALDRHEGAYPKKKGPGTRAMEFQSATRAYRLLSTALKGQGLARPATRFHYRAELMDRKALYQQGSRQWRAKGIKSKLSALATRGRWLLSFVLGFFSGYGDQLWRLFITYAVVVLGFAAAMLIFAVQVKENQPFSPATMQDVLVLSVTSFHGRGIQPPGLYLDDALATLAGAEAVFGLLIEGLFIAAFTRRVTGN